MISGFLGCFTTHVQFQTYSTDWQVSSQNFGWAKLYQIWLIMSQKIITLNLANAYIVIKEQTEQSESPPK